MIHHPKEYLADCERNAWGGHRAATFDYLAKMSHIILTGHTHADLRLWDQNEGEAYVCGGGAHWVSISYSNAFRLVKIDRTNELFEYKSFQWDASGLMWRELFQDRQTVRLFQNRLEREMTTACEAKSPRYSLTGSAGKAEVDKRRRVCEYQTSLEQPDRVVPVSQGVLEPPANTDNLDAIVKDLIAKIRRHAIRQDYEEAVTCWERSEFLLWKAVFL